MPLFKPPNLTDEQELGLPIRAGIDDWGGVSPLTADHVNPERPWPDLERLAELTERSGFVLRERLTAHPRYLQDADRWLDARVQPPLAALLAQLSAFPSDSGAARESCVC